MDFFFNGSAEIKVFVKSNIGSTSCLWNWTFIANNFYFIRKSLQISKHFSLAQIYFSEHLTTLTNKLENYCKEQNLLVKIYIFSRNHNIFTPRPLLMILLCCDEFTNLIFRNKIFRREMPVKLFRPGLPTWLILRKFYGN